MNIFLATLATFGGTVTLLVLLQALSRRRLGCRRSLLQGCSGTCGGPCHGPGQPGQRGES
jgi:hypothetical protein